MGLAWVIWVDRVVLRVWLPFRASWQKRSNVFERAAQSAVHGDVRCAPQSQTLNGGPGLPHSEHSQGLLCCSELGGELIVCFREEYPEDRTFPVWSKLT